VGRWSRLVAREFLAWLDPPAGLAWLDVGCGTGALTEAVAASCAPERLAGVDPSVGFLDFARRRLGAKAELRQGDAQDLPFTASEFDRVVSGPGTPRRPTDLGVWWEKGFYPQADQAITDIVAAFEWPAAAHGQPLVLEGYLLRAVVFVQLAEGRGGRCRAPWAPRSCAGSGAERDQVDRIGGGQPEQEDRQQHQAQHHDSAERGRTDHAERIRPSNIDALLAPSAYFIETHRRDWADQREARCEREHKRQHVIAES
jgi:SAM-dependent methyltransferase